MVTSYNPKHFVFYFLFFIFKSYFKEWLQVTTPNTLCLERYHFDQDARYKTLEYEVDTQ